MLRVPGPLLEPGSTRPALTTEPGIVPDPESRAAEPTLRSDNADVLSATFTSDPVPSTSRLAASFVTDPGRPSVAPLSTAYEPPVSVPELRLLRVWMSSSRVPEGGGPGRATPSTTEPVDVTARAAKVILALDETYCSTVPASTIGAEIVTLLFAT